MYILTLSFVVDMTCLVYIEGNQLVEINGNKIILTGETHAEVTQNLISYFNKGNFIVKSKLGFNESSVLKVKALVEKVKSHLKEEHYFCNEFDGDLNISYSTERVLSVYSDNQKAKELLDSALDYVDGCPSNLYEEIQSFLKNT